MLFLSISYILRVYSKNQCCFICNSFSVHFSISENVWCCDFYLFLSNIVYLRRRLQNWNGKPWKSPTDVTFFSICSSISAAALGFHYFNLSKKCSTPFYFFVVEESKKKHQHQQNLEKHLMKFKSWYHLYTLSTTWCLRLLNCCCHCWVKEMKWKLFFLVASLFYNFILFLRLPWEWNDVRWK